MLYQFHQPPIRRWSFPARCSIFTNTTSVSSLSCYNIGTARMFANDFESLAEMKEDDKVGKDIEGESKKANDDSGKDRRQREEEDTSGQELTRLDCFCFSGVSVSIIS